MIRLVYLEKCVKSVFLKSPSSKAYYDILACFHIATFAGILREEVARRNATLLYATLDGKVRAFLDATAKSLAFSTKITSLNGAWSQPNRYNRRSLGTSSIPQPGSQST